MMLSKAQCPSNNDSKSFFKELTSSSVRILSAAKHTYYMAGRSFKSKITNQGFQKPVFGKNSIFGNPDLWIKPNTYRIISLKTQFCCTMKV